MNPLQKFYDRQQPDTRECLLALQTMILQADAHITTRLQYGMPFFIYREKRFAYLWVHKSHGQPYIGLVEGRHFTENFLIQEKRSRMKIMLIDQHADLPVADINAVLHKAIALCRV